MNNYKTFIPYIIIGIIIIIFFSMKSCNDNEYQQLKGKYEILEEQLLQKEKTFQENEEKRKIKEDSLSKEISKRDSKYNKLLTDSKKLENEIAKSKNKPITIPKDLQGLKLYYDKRYDTNTEIIENKLGLPKETAMDVSYELEEGDNCNETVQLQDKQINNQNQQIDLLQKNIEDTKSLLSLEKETNKELESLNKVGKENIEVLKDQVKTLNNKNTFNKILIPVALGVGGFLGYQIAK